MRVIRVIMYESDDQARLDRQLEKSLQDGQYDLATRITVGTVGNDRVTMVGSRLDLYARLLKFLEPFEQVKQSLSGPPVGDPSIFDNKEQADAQADQV